MHPRTFSDLAYSLLLTRPQHQLLLTAAYPSLPLRVDDFTGYRTRRGGATTSRSHCIGFAVAWGILLAIVLASRKDRFGDFLLVFAGRLKT